nr:putative ABC transporter C family member 15 isoform X2 [Tanacetum cinerariifolium]
MLLRCIAGFKRSEFLEPWLQPGSPCLWESASIIIQLGLLAVLLIGFVKRLIESWCINKPKVKSREMSTTNMKIGMSYKLSLCCSVLLLGTHIMIPLTFKTRSEAHCKLEIPILSSEIMQIVSWVMTLIALYMIPKHKNTDFPWILRTWWLCTFFLTVSRFTLDVQFLVSYHGNPGLLEYIDFTGLISSTCLLFLAILGKTGIVLANQDIVTEPFLDVNQKHLLQDNLECPYGKASIFQLITFSWINPLFVAGNEKPLDQDEVPDVDTIDSASFTSEYFDKSLKQCDTNNPSIYKAIYFFTRKKIAINALFAITTTLALMSGNIPLTRAQKWYQSKIMEAKDARMKSTSEVLRNIKTLKLQAWDTHYLQKLEGFRKVEYNWLWKSLKLNALGAFVFWGAPTFISVLTFGGCALMGIPLTAGRVLSALATFRMLQDPIFNLPDLLNVIAQGKVSADRVASYLQEEEIQSDTVEFVPRCQTEIDITIENGRFSWDPESRTPNLDEIQLQVRRGMKVAICGTVGSGKSSLLSCVLGNIRDNILFGNAYDKTRYDKTIKACALTKDFELFSTGDLTEIGERGINMSGGQKQRIQIARAVYDDADTYLLDDPFSAVDAHTGTELFQECLLGMLKEKTVLYVTHQVEFLPAADLILVMQNGRIAQSGTFNELAKGSIGKEVYWAYLTLVKGGVLVPFILLAQSSFQLLQIGSNYWMAWACPTDSTEIVTGMGFILFVYTLLAVGSAFCILLRASLVAVTGLLTSEKLFSKMLHSVFRSPMAFFDSTPTGRILNRASTDQSVIDLEIANRIGWCAFSMIQLIGTMAVMSQVAWEVFAILIPVTAVCIWYQRYYLLTARELARLAGIESAPILHHFAESLMGAATIRIESSPILHHFAESLMGAATIRAFQQQDRFIEKNLCLIDNHSRPWFHNVAAIEWLCFRLNQLSNFVFAFSLVLLVTLPDGVIDPSIAGLAVTYGINLNVQQASVIWNICNAENKMISVERVLQYSKLTSESPLIIEDSRPSIEWPQNGTISFRNLKIRYADHLPSVLKSITCTFPGKKKVGVVGRTGSGKSTLIQAIFRVVEPTEGFITIDGVDICKIGLHDLRSRLSIIPQDPTMFEGTVRGNLDPLDQYPDADIWEALDKCQLGDIVRGKEKKLEFPVVEGGENWSVGQRQLFCLGRALLKKSSILVLDEATASIDSATDGILQKIITQEFKERTIVTIAHRIHTVIDSDLVLVLSDGKIAEYDSPAKLLERENSFFSRLIKEYSMRSNFDTK